MSDRWHSFMRVDPPESLAVRPPVTRRLAELQDELPRSRELEFDDADLVGTAIVRAGDDIADGAMAAAQAAHRAPLSFVDIVTANIRAFLILEAQVRYLRWRHRNLPKWQADLVAWAAENPSAAVAPPTFTPERTVDHVKQLEQWAEDMHARATPSATTQVPRRLPFDYVAGNRSGRSHELLNVLFGEGYRRRLLEAAGLRNPRLQQAALWPRLVACVWPVADAQAVARLRGLLAGSRTGLRSAVADLIDRTSVQFSAQRAELVTDQITALVTRYAPNGDLSQLTDDALLTLMGKPMSVDEFIHRLVIGFDILADEADLIGPELLEQLLEVKGIESFLEMVLQKSGHEHGYVFEVFLVVRELARVGDPDRIWMQIVVGGKQGPDIGRILDDAAGVRVQLIQAKSYRDVNALMRPSDTGEIWRQMRSDLIRLAKDNFMVTGPDGTRLPIDRRIEFAVDWWHLRTTSFRMEGIDPAELHALGEPPAAVSLAFYDRYIHDKLVKLQEELDSPAFRAEIGLADTDPGFSIDVDIVDRIIPDL